MQALSDEAGVGAEATLVAKVIRTATAARRNDFILVLQVCGIEYQLRLVSQGVLMPSESDK